MKTGVVRGCLSVIIWHVGVLPVHGNTVLLDDCGERLPHPLQRGVIPVEEQAVAILTLQPTGMLARRVVYDSVGSRDPLRFKLSTSTDDGSAG